MGEQTCISLQPYACDHTKANNTENSLYDHLRLTFKYLILKIHQMQLKISNRKCLRKSWRSRCIHGDRPCKNTEFSVKLNVPVCDMSAGIWSKLKKTERFTLDCRKTKTIKSKQPIKTGAVLQITMNNQS